MREPLQTGATIGILGGGQLGRMLAMAASRLGLRAHIFEPAADAPAAQVAHRCTTADYSDEAALLAFADSVDVITYEFENIPAEALDILGRHRPIHPGRLALATSQDRLTEKEFLTGLGLMTAPYQAVDCASDLHSASASIGPAAILKTRRFGYDGKGQIRLSPESDLDAVWAEMADAPSVLEGFVAFSSEISVIAARNASGQISSFDPGTNEHRGGILHKTTVPARISAALRTDAVLIASRILNALEYVGVMGVELFVTDAGLIVNEIAPRVHNSGHWTQQACSVDQFEQHIRAIAGWPLGDGKRHLDVEMVNLIGDDIRQVPSLSADGDVAIHMYGKGEARTGRKMGHYNRIVR